MQSKWAWKIYRRQFFAFSSSSQPSRARMRLAWGRSLRALHVWGSLLNWSTPSLNFSPPLSTHFQGQPQILGPMHSFDAGWSCNHLWSPPTRTWTKPWIGKSLKALATLSWSSRDGLRCGGSYETTCSLAWTRVVEERRTAFHHHGRQRTWRGVQPFQLSLMKMCSGISPSERWLSALSRTSSSTKISSSLDGPSKISSVTEQPAWYLLGKGSCVWSVIKHHDFPLFGYRPHVRCQARKLQQVLFSANSAINPSLSWQITVCCLFHAHVAPKKVGNWDVIEI